MWTIGTSLDAVADIFINAFNRHSTSVLGVASSWHLVVVISRRCHYDIGHLSRRSSATIATHDVLDDPSDFPE